MLAADLMTKAPSTIRKSATLRELIGKMVAERISGLPVVDESNNIVGIVTEGDLLRRAELGTEAHAPKWLVFLRGPARNADDYVRTHARVAEDIMTRDVATVGEAAPLDDVIRIMEQRRVRRVPVVRDGAVVGIVSRADLVRALGEALPPEQTVTAEDEAIRADLLALLNKQNWFQNCNVRVVVENGRVYLSGLVFDDSTRQALRVAATNVQGVASVDDTDLALAEPVTGMIG